MGVSVPELLDDLAVETEALDELLAALPADGWDTPTPAQGWAIRDQVSHLAYFDEAATLAVTDPQRFRHEAASLMARGADFADELAADYRQMSGQGLREWFRCARADLDRQLRGRDAADRMPWYGPDMSIASSLTARMMETWAHGQDIADALDARREPTVRLRHIAHLGVRTMPFSFAVRSRPAPEAPVRVHLSAPDGSMWTWGPEDAEDVVSGTAVDFCLAVTQRRHVTDTGLRVRGPVATEWMGIAQAFAGPPGPGRQPRS